MPTAQPATAKPTLGISSSPAASLSPSELASIYEAIQPQVEQIRGLQPTHAVSPIVIDEAQLRANLTAEFDHDNPPAQVASTEAILETLGLLPPGSSLRQLMLDLQSGEVAGYYSPDKDQLYVVSRSGTVGPLERSTYAHEFTHQLQDQNFNLSSLALDAPGQTDRSLARLALVEGDAVSVQETWMQQQLTPAELAQILGQALDPSAAAILQQTPVVLRDELLFPYQNGFAFVSQLIAAGGYDRVDAAFSDPPDSTEQILHPAKFLSREPPKPVTVPAGLATAAGAGWTETDHDVVGELLFDVWLQQGGLSSAVAADAAAGWGGDRLALLGGPGGASAVAIVSTWDTSADADAFAAAAQQAITGLKLTAEVVHRAASPNVSLAVGPVAAKLAAALEP
jgi:hypothetical protein